MLREQAPLVAQVFLSVSSPQLLSNPPLYIYFQQRRTNKLMLAQIERAKNFYSDEKYFLSSSNTHRQKCDSSSPK